MTRELKLDVPDDSNRLDHMAQGVIGKPLDRPDGAAKVSGTALYAAEYLPERCAFGVLVTAGIGKGRVSSLAIGEAEAMDGVIAVIADPKMISRPAQGTASEAPDQGVERIDYFGQPIALVVADSFEQARDAAKRLSTEYERDDTDRSDFDLPSRGKKWEVQQDQRQGNLDRAMADATYKIDVSYSTEGHAAAAMEPHATVAEWDGERLTVHAPLQMLKYNRKEIADSLDLRDDQVRIICPYVGGGFGSKLGVSPDIVAASLAAMKLGRSVRVVMSRQQVFQTIVRRPETEQRVRLAADADGKLTGLGHEAWVTNLPGEDFAEPVTQATEFLYGGEHRVLGLHMARIHRMLAGSVRAPGEAVGMQVLESAMDELANEVGIDPLELRLRNIPDRHPVSDKPYSSRKLAECLKLGAERFGWDGRDRRPCQRREGDWWIGTGMSSAARVHFLSRSQAQVSLSPDGTATVATDMTDIGTGSYAILRQIAAEMLGLDPDRVLVRLGDSDLPPSSGSGGSWGAPSTGSAVYLACEAIRAKLAQEMECEDSDMTLKDGMAICGNRSTPLGELCQGKEIVELGNIEPGKTSKEFAQATFGAFFAEVAVNAYSGEIRVRRMTGAFGIGRVLNEKTASSQCLGGMVWGIGSALSESLDFDPRDGHLTNCDLAEYHVPVHLDVPDIDVLLVDERDPTASPIQAKGVGELGICGAAGAIANAVHHACGVRVRHFPMTPDRLINELPDP